MDERQLLLDRRGAELAGREAGLEQAMGSSHNDNNNNNIIIDLLLYVLLLLLY